MEFIETVTNDMKFVCMVVRFCRFFACCFVGLAIFKNYFLIEHSQKE